MRQLLFAFAAILFAATSASAQSDGLATSINDWFSDDPRLDPLYIEGRVGLAGNPHPFSTTNGQSGEWEADGGFNFAVALGGYLAPDWRGELEFGMTSGSDGNFVQNGNSFPRNGDGQVYSILGNIFNEFTIPNEHFKPYVGAGLGLAIFNIDNLSGGAATIDDTDVVFNGALHLGIDIVLNDQFTFTTRGTVGITSSTDFDTNVPGLDVTKPTQFYAFLSAGIRFNLRRYREF
jgi:opacity protein-like surface antigen